MNTSGTPVSNLREEPREEPSGVTVVAPPALGLAFLALYEVAQ